MLLLFAAARQTAGTAKVDLPGSTVEEVLAAAVERFGSDFEKQLSSCRIWLNGEPSLPCASVTEQDELAVLPPISGGAAGEQ